MPTSDSMSGLSFTQVATWFINARKRVWKPLVLQDGRPRIQPCAELQKVSKERQESADTPSDVASLASTSCSVASDDERKEDAKSLWWQTPSPPPSPPPPPPPPAQLPLALGNMPLLMRGMSGDRPVWAQTGAGEDAVTSTWQYPIMTDYQDDDMEDASEPESIIERLGETPMRMMHCHMQSAPAMLPLPLDFGRSSPMAWAHPPTLPVLLSSSPLGDRAGAQYSPTQWSLCGGSGMLFSITEHTVRSHSDERTGISFG